jgi:hypothetical protein
MAHTGIMATKAECDSKVGELVDTTGWNEANINQWCSEAESFINVLCRENFSDTYAATLNTDVKKLLTKLCSNMVAFQGVKYNMGSYNSRIEAETLLDALWAEIERDIALLSDNKAVKFIRDPTSV